MDVSRFRSRARSTTARGTYPDCGECEAADDINKVCIDLCADDEVCVDGECQSDDGGGGGSDCAPCYTKDPITGDCVYDCAADEVCENGECVPDDTFDPSDVYISSCPDVGSVEESQQFTIELSVTNRNTQKAEFGVTVNVGSDTYVNTTETAAGGGTSTFTYTRTAFLDPGDYDVNASISNPTAASTMEFRQPECPAGLVWDPIGKQCIPEDGESCPDGQVYVPERGECVDEEKVGEGDVICPQGHHWSDFWGECVQNRNAVDYALPAAGLLLAGGIYYAKREDMY